MTFPICPVFMRLCRKQTEKNGEIQSCLKNRRLLAGTFPAWSRPRGEGSEGGVRALKKAAQTKGDIRVPERAYLVCRGDMA